MSPILRLSGILRLSLVLGALGFPAAVADPMHSAPVENASQIRALIIGIDQYQHLAPLKGAVADARDIEASLRQIGVQDITSLLDEKADRDSILKTVDDLRSRIRPGDLIILSVAGHGAQEPERVKGSESDGKDVVFLLNGFDTAAAGTRQRILDKEFNHLIKTFESLGARVLFLADTCSGGGLAREVDPRASEMSYRSVPTYTISDDELKPVSTPSDAFATELDFDRTIFLAAVDKNSKAPEIRIPGVDGYRGALSYAFARALEGAADSNGDGKITIGELFAYVRQVTYQLSDQRQTIVSASAPSLNVATELVVNLTRSVTLVTPPFPILPQANLPQPSSLPPLRPVRIAALDGASAQLAGLTPLETKFEVVSPAQNPELIWDPQSGDVLSGGDVVSRDVSKSDLPSVIDRVAAVRALKQIAARSVQPMRLLPDNKLHHLGAQVEVEVDQLSDRALLLFNVAGDGTIQLLYPQSTSEASLMRKPQHRLHIQVRPPFGADQIVAITAPYRMVELEQAFRKLNARRASGQIVKLLSRHYDAGMRLGSIGVFTAP